MQPSANIIAYIARTEQFSPRAYLDPPHNTAGKYSIGYGHQIQPNERNLLTATLTQAQAQSMLAKDLQYYVNSLNRDLKRPVSQDTFDGLLDFYYNDGTGAGAKVVQTWNATGDSTQLANHLKEYVYVHVGGQPQISQNLVARRGFEASLIQGLGFVVAEAEKKSTT